MSEQEQGVLDLMERLRDSLREQEYGESVQLPAPGDVPHFEDEQPAASTSVAKAARFVPEPGVYHGVPEEDYLYTWKAASSSRLSKLLKSPAHMQAGDDGEYEESAAQAEGHALHCAILEPDAFPTRYVVAEVCQAVLKSGERKGQRCTNAGLMIHKQVGWVCGQHLKSLDKSEFETLSQKAITAGVRQMCLNARDSVYRNRAARILLECDGESELSVVYDYGLGDGRAVRVKTRWDRHAYGIRGGAILDVKKTRDAGRRAFRKTIFDYGYHRQGELYLQAAVAEDAPARHFVWLAVETDPPYAVGVYRMLDEVREAARRQLGPLLRLYDLVTRHNFRDGYPDRVEDIGLPPWAWEAMEQEIDNVERMYADLSRRIT